MKPRLVMLEGDYDNIEDYEDYLGMDLTRQDVDDPEFMGIIYSIIKAVYKGGKAITKGAIKRHRRKESERVAAARSRIILQRRRRKAQAIEKARSIQASLIAQARQKMSRKNLLLLGIPIVGIVAFMLMRGRKD